MAGRRGRQNDAAAVRAVRVHQVLVWVYRAGRAVLVVAAVSVLLFRPRSTGQVGANSSPAGERQNRAAAMISAHLGVAAFPVASTADAVTVETAGRGCWQVGITTDGRPVWPASPIACPPGEVTVDTTVAGRSASTVEYDAATGWAREVVAGGHPERWTAPGVPVPSGPWVGHVTGVNVKVTSNGAGLWVAVSGEWSGRPFEAGWQVALGPHGNDFEITSVRPATGGVEPPPSTATTTSSTTTTTTTTKGAKE
jgi:hypothetical protein